MPCECRIVGDLDIGLNGVISINVSANSKISKTIEGDIVKGPKEKTISISAYPFDPGESDKTGCATKISSQFKWTKVHSCDDDSYHYIYQNIGNVSVLGDVPEGLIELSEVFDQGVGYNASATAGPYSYYIGDTIKSAFSIEYFGNPIDFNSANREDMVMSIGNIAEKAFLTSFSFSGGLGTNVPTVNYTFTGTDAKILDDQVIQCDSISISYDVHGVATVSMVVYSPSKTLDIASLPRIFGGVTFKLTGASADITPVPFSDCYKYNVSLVGIGE